MRALSRELLRAAEEIDRIKAVPLTLVRRGRLLSLSRLRGHGAASAGAARRPPTPAAAAAAAAASAGNLCRDD